MSAWRLHDGRLRPVLSQATGDPWSSGRRGRSTTTAVVYQTDHARCRARRSATVHVRGVQERHYPGRHVLRRAARCRFVLRSPRSRIVSYVDAVHLSSNGGERARHQFRPAAVPPTPVAPATAADEYATPRNTPLVVGAAVRSAVERQRSGRPPDERDVGCGSCFGTGPTCRGRFVHVHAERGLRRRGHLHVHRDGHDVTRTQRHRRQRSRSRSPIRQHHHPRCRRTVHSSSRWLRHESSTPVSVWALPVDRSARGPTR